jgi:SAM-dependent methyltransferase
MTLETGELIERDTYQPQGTDTHMDSALRAPGVSEAAVYQRIVSEISHLAQFPPGKDPYMGAFYGAVVDLLGQGQQLSGLVADVLSQRDIELKHFVNLLYRGIQYVELFERKNPDYPFAYSSKDAWQDELTDLLTHNGAALKEVLLHKSTTTTIYQRYAGTHAVLSALYAGRPLAVADFGCGGNYGLRGMDIQEPFKPFVDTTEGKLVTQLTMQPVPIGNGTAIDLQDPYDPEITAWRLACSFYPQELHTLPAIMAMERRLAQSQHTQFLQGDLLALPVGTPDLPVRKFDAVVMNTVCYQMPEAQGALIETARKLLKPEGLVIIQDFAEKDPKCVDRLHFGVNWHKEPFFYRTFITGEQTGGEIQELLQWNDGRCKVVQPGKDYALLQPVLFKPAF